MPCNGKLIAQLHKQLGWTQNDLGKKSGFTERLIVKAEASQNLPDSTVHIIAETFREGGSGDGGGSVGGPCRFFARVYPVDV